MYLIIIALDKLGFIMFWHL